MKKLFIIPLAILAAGFVFISCSKPGNLNNLPAPPPSTDEGNTTPGGEGDGGDGGNEDDTWDPVPPGWDETTHCSDIGQVPIILTYFTEYNEALPDVRYLTHINYAHGRFADPTNGTGGIVITESKKAPIKDVVALKSVNPRLKVCLMVGGWGAHADGFSMMARDPAKRTEFCQSIKSLLDQHQMDGIDIDWEYPTQSADNETGCDKSDTQNFNLVLKELRETIGTDKIISFASSSSAKYVDWNTAMKYLDYVNVMTYDMGSAPNGHNSPLHKSDVFNQRSWDESIEAHVDGGVPKVRQVMGIPFYGKAEKPPQDKNSPEYAIYAANKIFEYSVKYYEIPDILEKGKYNGKALVRPVFRVWEPTSKVPYLRDNNWKNVLSYDDPESVAEKGAYIKANKLLGAMFWEYRYDTEDHALNKAAVSSIYGRDTVLQ